MASPGAAAAPTSKASGYCNPHASRESADSCEGPGRQPTPCAEPDGTPVTLPSGGPSRERRDLAAIDLRAPSGTGRPLSVQESPASSAFTVTHRARRRHAPRYAHRDHPPLDGSALVPGTARRPGAAGRSGGSLLLRRREPRDAPHRAASSSAAPRPAADSPSTTSSSHPGRTTAPGCSRRRRSSSGGTSSARARPARRCASPTSRSGATTRSTRTATG